MRKLSLFIGVIALLGAAGLAPAVTGQSGGAASLAAEELLLNADFEGSYSARVDPVTGIPAGELEVADGWELWYNPDQSCPPHDPDCNPESYNRRPEYKPETNSLRVKSGAKSQKFFTSFGTHTAGLYQQASVPAGSWVRFSIWAMAWSSDRDVIEYSFYPGYYGVSVGVDPTGGDDWASPEIQWTVPITRHDEWIYLEIDAYTESGEISVWTHSQQIYAVKHNDSHWDDASLIVLESPPAPTPTASPTATPYPTPDPTPDGWDPPQCALLLTTRLDAFEAGLSPGWDQDPGEGTISTAQGYLHLKNKLSTSREFPLAWLDAPWPESGDIRISLRFAYNDATGYGSLIGVGSAAYSGERTPDGAPPIWGIGDILVVQHASSGQTTVKLLGEAVWTGPTGDEDWHSLTLELRQGAYIAYVDGQERGRGVSYWQPLSLFAGNPQIVLHKGAWTEVALDDVRVETCHQGLWVPLSLSEFIAPPTPTPPPPTRQAPG